MHKRTLGALATATALTAALGFSVGAAQANTDAHRVSAHGDCTAGSTWLLRATAHDQGHGGATRVLFRIDSADGGQTWDWQLSDNSVVKRTGEAVSDSGGTVTVKSKVRNQQGSDLIDVTATNTTTGEVCDGQVTL
jgi:hypothetical protein